jgi:hypothetical protein
VHEAQVSGNPHQLAFAYTCALIMAAGHHDLERARDAYTQARRWAELVNNQVVLTQTPLFLAMASSEDEPLEALSLVRDAIAGSATTGQWGNLDFALRRIILPLVRLGRHRSAALLLGGLTGLTTATPDTQHVVPRAKTALTNTLGAELDPLLHDGQALARHELVRLALDEIDIGLAST